MGKKSEIVGESDERKRINRYHQPDEGRAGCLGCSGARGSDKLELDFAVYSDAFSAEPGCRSSLLSLPLPAECERVRLLADERRPSSFWAAWSAVTTTIARPIVRER
jgi:hypothetical protein